MALLQIVEKLGRNQTTLMKGNEKKKSSEKKWSIEKDIVCIGSPTNQSFDQGRSRESKRSASALTCVTSITTTNFVMRLRTPTRPAATARVF